MREHTRTLQEVWPKVFHSVSFQAKAADELKLELALLPHTGEAFCFNKQAVPLFMRILVLTAFLVAVMFSGTMGNRSNSNCIIKLVCIISVT